MKIINDDAYKVLPSIKDKCVDLIIADLNFGVLNKGNESAKKFNTKMDLNKLWKEHTRILKPGGVIIMFGQGAFTAELINAKPSWYKYTVIWKKGNSVTNFLNASKQPLRNHEDILVFYFKNGTYNPQMGVGEKQYAPTFEKNPTSRYKDSTYGEQRDVRKEDTDKRYPISIIEFEPDREQFIPTQKPVELIRYLIRTYSNPGDLVLDYCMGSGTTAIASRFEKRHFIGVEIDPENFQIAFQRVEDYVDVKSIIKELELDAPKTKKRKPRNKKPTQSTDYYPQAKGEWDKGKIY